MQEFCFIGLIVGDCDTALDDLDDFGDLVSRIPGGDESAQSPGKHT